MGGLAAAGLLAITACSDDSGDTTDPEDPDDVAEEVEAPEEGETAATSGCRNHDTSDEAEADAATADAAALEDLDLTLTEIGQFDAPTALVSRPDDTALFVTERAGRVIRIERAENGDGPTWTAEEEPVLDLTDEVVDEGFEQGLLDLAFSPDGEHLYLSYTADGETEGGDSTVTAYSYDGGSVDEASRREVLVQSQPFPEHNGGNIFFGPDGCLYVGLGDGTPVGDAYENGQDTGSLLGTILRIDPEATWDTDEGYQVPADNPFAGDGDDEDEDARAEIWLYGVRNPWRSSFDPVTGDLWVGDVGEHEREEINFLPAAEGAGRGANLGWSDMEADEPFNAEGNPEGALLPLHVYTREDGASVTGGVVYRGEAIPELRGAYLFGDWADPRLRALTLDGAADDGASGEPTATLTWFDEIDLAGLASFGVDSDGEVYLVSLQGSIYRLES